jgi:H+/Cl- antiporter ClcA
MLSRLAYALIGFVFGALLGVLLWWFFGLGFQPNPGRASTQPNPLIWVKYTAVVCAVIGFIAKDRVGDFVGSTIQTVFHIEMGTSPRGDWHAPTWLIVLVLLAVAFAVWHFTK